MRVTTELTTHFLLNVNLIGSHEIDLDLSGEHELGSIEFFEAFDREEDLRMRGQEGLLDPLDFDTVPFESVVDDLSMELFAQDEADDRGDHSYDTCACCGQRDLDDDWGDKLYKVGRSYYCADCYEGALRRLHLTEEMVQKLNDKELEKKRAKWRKFRDALQKAKELRPDMNWSKYEHSMYL